MTTYEIITTIISAIGAIVSIASFIFSFFTRKKINDYINKNMVIKNNNGISVYKNNGDINVNKEQCR